jgi:hypothetical protein
MPAEGRFRLSTIGATVFTTLVAPLAVSLVSNAIKAESTTQVRPAGEPIRPATTGLPDLSQPAVMLLPPTAAPGCSSSAPRPCNTRVSAKSP